MGFLAPWFLAGLAALGVPVFVHLLRRHTATPRPVSSLMFFERGTQSSTRHRRLGHLLLFALRTALVLLVVLAFANPFVRRSAASAKGRIEMLVLDNSFSMRAGTRFADAKRQALETLAAKPHGGRAQIVALGGEVEILTQPITDDAQLRAALESIQPGDGHASYGELRRAVRSLADATHEPIDVHLFSDMQRSAMPANLADALVPTDAMLKLHAVASGTAAPNWTVESVEAPAELSDPKDPKRSRVRAVIAGFNTPAATKTVSLEVNGKTIATKKVDVPASGRATVEFASLDVSYGANRCAVKIDGGDAMAADDASVFAVKRADPERVMFVHAARDTRSATYFGAALRAAAQSAFVLQSTNAEQTEELDPARFAFVVLADAEALPSRFEHALDQYAAKGGNVLMVLGTGAAARTALPLWGGQVERTQNYAPAGKAAGVGQVDLSYAALQQAQDAGKANRMGGWADVKVFYAATVDEKDARVAARLGDGTPLLLEKRIGEGRVLLLTSGIENLTNDLPLHPVFVAFVDRAARYLAGSEQAGGAALVDGSVQLRASGEPMGAATSAEVIDPDGRRPLTLEEARRATAFRLARAGFYQIRFANGHDALIGVNPDRRESDLTPLPNDMLQLWSGSDGTGQTGTIANATTAGSERESLWWYAMLLALATAIAEIALASGYMGRQREEA